MNSILSHEWWWCYVNKGTVTCINKLPTLIFVDEMSSILSHEWWWCYVNKGRVTCINKLPTLIFVDETSSILSHEWWIKVESHALINFQLLIMDTKCNKHLHTNPSNLLP